MIEINKKSNLLEQPSYKYSLQEVEEPNLYNAQLQDSYGVSTPEDLIREMVDKPGEYAALVRKVQEMNGFADIDQKREQAKN